MFGRVIKITVLALVAALILTGCAGKEDKESPLNQIGLPGAKGTKVGIVLSPPGKGDMSVNDAVLTGLKKAQDKFDIELEVLEPGMKKLGEPVNSREALKYLAENNYDLIIAVGAQMQKVLIEVAPEYSDIRFAMIDGVAEAPNVLNISFAAEDNAFLAGAAAASLTSTGYVGFIGGNQMDQETSYENGFGRGVQYINMTEGKQVKVLVTYAGVSPEALKNPERGKALAVEQYQAGADIIYHAAGQTGMGVFQAAAQERKWAIGSDGRNGSAPASVYGTTLKRIDTAVYDIVKDLTAGKYQAGTRIFGIREGGVAFLPGPSMAPEVAAKLNLLAGQVARGRVVINKIVIPNGLKIIKLNVPVDLRKPQTTQPQEPPQSAYPGTPGAAAARSRQNGGQPNLPAGIKPMPGQTGANG